MEKEKIKSIFSNIPTIETDRLILRRILPSDFRDMYEYSCSSVVTKYLLWKPHKSIEYTRQYSLYLQDRYRIGEFYDWAITVKGDGKMIGTVGFSAIDFNNNSAEIGYVLNESYWHHGYASEAIRAVLKFGFIRLEFDKISAKYMQKNSASRRTLDRCGFNFEKTVPRAIKRRFGYTDVSICSVLSTEFSKNHE